MLERVKRSASRNSAKKMASSVALSIPPKSSAEVEDTKVPIGRFADAHVCLLPKSPIPGPPSAALLCLSQS